MTDRYIEFRLYKLKPGMRDKFAVIAKDAAEMLGRHKIAVVGHGPSAHDADSYFLMRAYPSLEAREKALAGFYGSDEWAKRFNDAVMGMIESYNTIVLEASDPAINEIARRATST
jgi:hypothetical protein